jgi:cytoskeletal protein RodZ
MKRFTKQDGQESAPSLDKQRAEKLAEMGAQLWTNRLEKGLSLEEMVVSTRIPRRLLQAIEEANLDDLPEPIYIQGLIRQYADALGFNGAEFSSSFPIGTNRVNLRPIWKTKASGQLRPVHLYLVYIGIIVCSVSGLSQFLNSAALQANGASSTQKQKSQPLVQPNKISNTVSSGVQSVSDRANKKDEQQVQIGVTLKEKSWIKVVADGKTTFDGELPQGTQRTWKAKEELTVKAGNAGGVLVSVNQEKAKQMGEPGKVKEVTIASEAR